MVRVVDGAHLSADGHAVLFNRYDEGAGLDYQIGFRPIEAAGAVLLGTGQATALSPDGKWAIGITYSTPGLFALPIVTRAANPDDAGVQVFNRRMVSRRHAPSVYCGTGERSQPRRMCKISKAAPLGRCPHEFPSWSLTSERACRLTASGSLGGRRPAHRSSCRSRRRAARPAPSDRERCSQAMDHRRTRSHRRAESARSDYLTLARYELATGRLDPLRTITLADTSGLRRFDLMVSPDGRTVV